MARIAASHDDRGRRHRPGLWLVVVALCLLALGAEGRAHADAFEVADTTWEGGSELLSILRGELGDGRVLPVAVLDWSQVRPDDGLLVLYPLEALDPDESAAFMRAGGRLAVVDDFGRGGDTLERYRIERVPAPLRPVAALRNRSDLPIAEPVVDVAAGRPTGPHPVVARVDRVVLNHPTALRHPNLSAVLRVRAVGEPDAIVAVAGQVGKGRLFAMSDPSAFINEMLRYPGNRELAAGLARYLVDQEGHGKGRLWVVTGRFSQEGAMGGDESLGKSLEARLRSLAEALHGAREEGLPSWAYLTLAAFVLLAVGLWVGRSAARPYRAPEPRYVKAQPLVSQGGAAGRLALLAAPSSARGLVLLEWKSALAEALAHRFQLGAEPGAEQISRLLDSEGHLDAPARRELAQALALMREAESRVLAGRAPEIPREALARAVAAIRAGLSAVDAAEPTKGLVSKPALGTNAAPLSPGGAPEAR